MNKLGDLMIWGSIFTLSLVIPTWYGYLKVDKNKQVEEIRKYENSISINSDNPYYGYINFPSYNMNRLIKTGNPNKVIEEGYIGIYGYMPKMIPVESLILVGHSRSNIFSILHKIKKYEKIELIKEDKKYQYIINKKIIINVDDYKFLSSITSNQLILITCLDDNSKRLVIIGNYNP